jgi:hypothetical protein
MVAGDLGWRALANAILVPHSNHSNSTNPRKRDTATCAVLSCEQNLPSTLIKSEKTTAHFSENVIDIIYVLGHFCPNTFRTKYL